MQDKHGNTAITQPPNLPIIVWAVATVASHLFKQGILHSIFSLTALFAIVYWAYLEIFQGTSYLRRTLGVVVLGITIYSRFFA